MSRPSLPSTLLFLFALGGPLPSCGGDDEPSQATDSGSATEPRPKPTTSASASITGSGDSGSESDDGSAGSDDGSAETSGPGPTCGDPLTQWEQMMLDSHNEWRAAVDPPADQMHRIYWDTTIAQNAADWVASCDPNWPHSPDEERAGVGGYEALGENLSYCAGTGCADDPGITDGSGKGDGIGWWEERHDYDWDTDSETGITSHYTQLTSSNIYAMGCATQLCSAPGPFGWDDDWWWTICQYGPRGQGYWSGTKPYEAGAGGLVDPPASVFDEHPGLCGP